MVTNEPLMCSPTSNKILFDIMYIPDIPVNRIIWFSRNFKRDDKQGDHDHQEDTDEDKYYLGLLKLGRGERSQLDR